MKKAIKLEKSHKVILKPSQPFSFEKTFYKPSHFPSKLESFSKENKSYSIPYYWKNNLLGVKFTNCGRKISISVFSDKKINSLDFNELISELDYKFSLSMDYTYFYKKFAHDKFLKSSINRIKGKHICTNYSLYHHLIVSIFLQNTTIKRTISMCDAMLEKYGTKILFDNTELIAMWEPNKLKATEKELRNLKLGYRSKFVLKVTDIFIGNKLNEKILRNLDTKTLVKELLKIYGVGKQTVFYLALSQFQRTEYLEHIPLWERKIISKYIFNKTLIDEKEILEWFESKYDNWCGYSFSLIWEDIFFQHKKKPLPWLLKILKEKISMKK